MGTKETMIVFVYDTECLKEEADDPVSAVLYFHPSWVSDTQKVALCGQLMGTTFFLKDCFFKPRIISLRNGKFMLKEFGRFMLAVGTDRNISDKLLEHRADMLSGLLKLYHRDLQSLYDNYAQPAQLNILSGKLYHIFETYLPMLQRNGNIFQNVPKLRMPKTASHIFLEAIQTLQCCQQTKGILGGAILYHNKVVASQLDESLTKQLVISDPRHVRTAAEQLNNQQFHIPNGVQMLVIYVDLQQYRQLAAEAQRAQNMQTTQLAQNGIGMPFQYSKRKLKRDKSLIFTHIPEEEQPTATTSSKAETGQSEMPAARPKSMRPTHLPLRLKSVHSKEPESGIASINFDETDSYPEFIGRTSVCSTPMTENKVLPVANVMSICANPEEDSNSNGKTGAPTSSTSRRNSLKLDVEKFFQNFISNPQKQMTRRKSSADLQDALRLISKKLGSISQNFKTDVNRNGGSVSETGVDAGSVDSPDYIENDEQCGSLTITDPTYPVFNSNGQPISRSLFQQFLDQYHKLWGVAKEQAKEDAELAALVAEFQEFNNEIQKLDEYMQRQATAAPAAATTTTADSNLNIAVKTPLDKKSLSLPLKPISDPLGEQVSSRRKLSNVGGVPLTPLLAKLSVLALSDVTPAASNIEIQTPLNSSKVFPRRSSLKCDDAVDALTALPTGAPPPETVEDDSLQRTELYVCGQQNMTLLLLMEEGVSQQQLLVQQMFDICVANFPHMESQLNQTLNVNVEGDSRDGSYSFMCIDKKWDTLQRNGPWNPMELSTLESMHYDLEDPNGEITDLILRSNDSVFYGYKRGRTEFLYKEPANDVHGIPPPSDAMSNVQTRAKTRLERDHSYMLF
ncbi:uncharacterized protein LOC115633652 isoform X2 [Scaptodrosophila lebanonensis]|uniref:Uncharacterized protein LOC115633652 isoform X2 n=1 Tax=Drosophila lebanonensis TaxID=7225 RepID=A0A6J2UEQ8_DROLE|nr:uncharacterized protein LOC115633652 isoform X2 [Scaptodrosophila lebanonensis]